MKIYTAKGAPTKAERRSEVMRKMRDLAREAMEWGYTYRGDVIEDVAAWEVGDDPARLAAQDDARGEADR